jgi:ABC-type Na+ transport system ATPase subunit NatA
MKGVWESYGTRAVLRGVGVVVEAGRLAGVVGGNGAGKTTPLRTMVGELTPGRGTVHREGEVGCPPQQMVINPLLTAAQHLELFQAAYRLPDVEHALALLEVLGYPGVLEQRTGMLSGGARQKLNPAPALMHQPTLLVLDESYQGFDRDTHQRSWRPAQELRDDGQAVAVASPLLPRPRALRHGPRTARRTAGREDAGRVSTHLIPFATALRFVPATHVRNRLALVLAVTLPLVRIFMRRTCGYRVVLRFREFPVGGRIEADDNRTVQINSAMNAVTVTAGFMAFMEAFESGPLNRHQARQRRRHRAPRPWAA